MQPADVCREALADVDPGGYVTYLARRGCADAEALWLLHDRHRVMAPAQAWLFAAHHARELDASLSDIDTAFA